MFPGGLPARKLWQEMLVSISAGGVIMLAKPRFRLQWCEVWSSEGKRNRCSATFSGELLNQLTEDNRHFLRSL